MHAGADDALRRRLGEAFRLHAVSEQVEIQQRSVEYYVMTDARGNALRLRSVMQPMPNFPDRASALEGEVVTAGGGAADTVAVRRARAGASVRVAPPPIAAASRPAGASERAGAAESVPTMGLFDLLGGVPVPDRSEPDPSVAAASIGGLEDLLGAPAPPPALSPRPAVSSDRTPSFASGRGYGASPAAPPRGAGPVDPMAGVPPSSILPSVDLGECLKKLRAAENGLLYEDPYVQIGAKSRWLGNRGRVVLYLGNKHSADLKDVSVALVSSALPTDAEGHGLASRLEPVPISLGPKKQVQVVLELAAMRPYSSPPKLSVKYSAWIECDGGGSGNRVFGDVLLETPYECHKFLQPWDSDDPNAFFAKWRELQGKAQDVKVVRANPAMARSGGAGDVERCLRDVGLTPRAGLDPNPRNVVAGGIVPYASAPGTVVMVRVESDANDSAVFRITVAADDPATVAGVQKALLSQME
jgi:AP-2 complex subunit alpha